MFITNKLESIKKINELGLNKFPEQLFSENDTEKVKEFLSKYPAKYYAIRDKSKAGGIFKLKVAYEHVLSEIKYWMKYGASVVFEFVSSLTSAYKALALVDVVLMFPLILSSQIYDFTDFYFVIFIQIVVTESYRFRRFCLAEDCYHIHCRPNKFHPVSSPSLSIF